LLRIFPGQKPHPPHQASLWDVKPNGCVGTRLNAGSADAWTNWTTIGWKAITPTEQSGSANVYTPQMVVDPTLPVHRQVALVRCSRYQTSSEGAHSHPHLIRFERSKDHVFCPSLDALRFDSRKRLTDPANTNPPDISPSVHAPLPTSLQDLIRVFRRVRRVSRKLAFESLRSLGLLRLPTVPAQI
jgi:hypothetical protein